MDRIDLTLNPIGYVESPLTDRTLAPKQADEGAPEAWLVLNPEVRAGLRDLAAGQEIIVVTWLDRAVRDTLEVRPRGDQTKPTTGVFCTRSPDRPNPIGLHTVKIMEIDDLRLRVEHLEAIDGTPVLDLKPLLCPPGFR
jgi:tRNA-Thr(GGU) m(6)t(6)A37 methyltransferase TsaA